MFGNIGSTFTAGFTQLTDIQEKLAKLKNDFESGIETSLGINHEALGATSEEVQCDKPGAAPLPLGMLTSSPRSCEGRTCAAYCHIVSYDLVVAGGASTVDSMPAGRSDPNGAAEEASGSRGAQQSLHSSAQALASPLAAAGPSESPPPGPGAAQEPAGEHNLQQQPTAAHGAAAEAAAGATEQAPQPQLAALPGPAGAHAASAAAPGSAGAAPDAQTAGPHAALESGTGREGLGLGEAAGGWDADVELDLSEADAEPAAAQPEPRSVQPEQGRSAAHSQGVEDAAPLPAAAGTPAAPVASGSAAAPPAAMSLRDPSTGEGPASAGAAWEAPAADRDFQPGAGSAAPPAADAAQHGGGESDPGRARNPAAHHGHAARAIPTSNGGAHAMHTLTKSISPVLRGARGPAAPPPDGLHAVPGSLASPRIGSAGPPACAGLPASAPGTPAAAGTCGAAGAAAQADGEHVEALAPGGGDAAGTRAGVGLDGGVPGHERGNLAEAARTMAGVGLDGIPPGHAGGDLGEASGGRAESGGAESTASTSHREPAALLEADGDSAPRKGAAPRHKGIGGIWFRLGGGRQRQRPPEGCGP